MPVIHETQKFRITQEKRDYFIENLTQGILTVVVKQHDCGLDGKTLTTLSIPPGDKKQIKIYSDQTYKLIISDVSVTHEFILPVYDVTLKQIIKRVHEYLCGCDCSNCDDCNEDADCKAPLELLTMMTAYLAVTHPLHTNITTTVNNHLKCIINASLLCNTGNIQVLGKSDMGFFLKQLIAYNYLILYIYASFNTIDEDDLQDVSEFFKYDKIRPCIKKLGINPGDMVDEILSGLTVSYWQYNDVVSDINTVISSWSSSYLSSIPGIASRPLEDFEQGWTVNYTNIGRIGFAVYLTELSNFSLYDSLGNDITDDFDVHYFSSDKTVVFVSKIPYSHSNIYFKFKKNVYI